MSPRPAVLCVDDEPHVLEGLRDLLRRDFTVLTTTRGFEAVKLATEHEVEAVVCDMRMPVIDGPKLLGLLREHAPDVPRLVLTGQADVESAALAVNEGDVFRFLLKPASREELVTSIAAAIEHGRRRRAELEVLEHTVGGVVDVLGEVLGALRPGAHGHAARVGALVAHAAPEADVPLDWALRTAAALVPLGDALAETTATPDDLGAGLAAAATLLRRIPRFEPVADLLDPAVEGGRADALLHAAIAIDHADGEPEAALARLRATSLRPALGRALEVALAATGTPRPTESVRLRAVRTGSVFAQDVRRADGTLLVARGVVMAPMMATRLSALPPADANLLVIVHPPT